MMTAEVRLRIAEPSRAPAQGAPPADRPPVHAAAVAFGDAVPFCPRHLWLQRFGMRLLRLCPDLSAMLAARRALDCFRDMAELEPERAAQAVAEAEICCDANDGFD